MADSVLPVVKGVYVCDEVLSDPRSGKVSLLNAFVTVRPSSGFPFVDAIEVYAEGEFLDDEAITVLSLAETV